MAIVDVIAEVTGTVWTVDAEVGQALAEDDSVITVESMKMEIPVAAPEDGTVTEMLVAKGDAVSEGQCIAKMDV